MKSLPLSDLLVVEFTHAVMGPSAGVILGDLGAEVIRVEPPNGDPTRRLKGMGAGYFTFYNRNKKSICLNLKDENAIEIARDLVAKADILLENFAPGTMDRLGLGFNTLKEVNPRLIYCSLKGFLDGPYQNRLAMDEVVQMMGGLAYMTGPTGQPLRAGTSIIDITGGMFGVIGILSALERRHHSGKGALVQSSLFETTAFSMGQHMAAQANSGEAVPPMPERKSAWSVYQIYKTKDQKDIFIGIISDKQWVRFVEHFGVERLKSNSELASNEMRIAAKSWLQPLLLERVNQLTLSEISQICDVAQVCYAPVAKPEDLYEDPHLAASGGLLSTQVADGSLAKLPNLPLAIDGERVTLERHPPNAGENGRDILVDRLGLCGDEIDSLVSRGVLSIPDGNTTK